MAVMVVLWQKILIKTIQVNFVLIPSEVGMRTQNELNCFYYNFCHRPIITAISWLPPGFHNFFMLAILCRASRLGHTFFLQLEWLF